MGKGLLLSIFFIVSGQVLAQQTLIMLDAATEEAVNNYNRNQLAQTTIPVYTIQFKVTSDRHEMERDLQTFRNEFKLKPKWTQKGPYYYLKAGAYRTKMEGYADMKAISAKYSGAVFIVEKVKKQFILE